METCITLHENRRDVLDSIFISRSKQQSIYKHNYLVHKNYPRRPFVKLCFKTPRNVSLDIFRYIYNEKF